MCSVSTVSARFIEQPPMWHNPGLPWPPIEISSFRDAELRAEIEKLKLELELARAQDIKDNNPDCHMEDKVTIIRGLAKALGVDLGDVFAGHK